MKILFPNLRQVYGNAVIAVLVLSVFLVLFSLGTWQTMRLHEKNILAKTISERSSGPPVSLPDTVINAEEHAFLHVIVRGTFDYDQSRFVKAVTKFGPGYWLMTPLVMQDGTVWINRGFIPARYRTAMWKQEDNTGEQTVEGLIRMSEPGGSFLEKNIPEKGLWRSRDVIALSRDTGLTDALEFFIDSGDTHNHQGWPAGGLTVTALKNPHLAYAFTWYAMAILFAFTVIFLYMQKNGFIHRKTGPEEL